MEGIQELLQLGIDTVYQAKPVRLNQSKKINPKYSYTFSHFSPGAAGVSAKENIGEEEELPLWRAKLPEINKDSQALRREGSKVE